MESTNEFKYQIEQEEIIEEEIESIDFILYL